MKISDYNSCSTAGVRALDLQLIQQIDRIAPRLLRDFSHLNVQCGAGCHAFLQNPAIEALSRAIRDRGKKLIVNSAYRTVAQQAILYAHYKNGRCGISAAAVPGRSNHNTGLALDVEDASGWRLYLERYGWDWIGSFDPMHFDFKGGNTKDLSWLSIKAFQQLWNFNNPRNRIIEDGQWGAQTEKALLSVSSDGFDAVPALNKSEAAPDMPPRAKVLREGDTGEEIKKLQEKLKITVDGFFGFVTTEAVKQFQKENGLVADGVVGVGTRTLLAI